MVKNIPSEQFSASGINDSVDTKNTLSEQPSASGGSELVDVEDILKLLTPSQREVIEVAIERSYSGPIPSPEAFERYEIVLPGSADRIISMAEKALDTRTGNEDIIIKERLRQSGRGQILGFILALFFGVIALVLALTDHEILAGIIANVDIISLAIIFVLNREPSSKRENKK